MTRRVALRSDAAGATVTIEFDDEGVRPTEALARVFADAVRKLIEENPWDNAPPTDVALAWSLASVVSAAANRIEEREGGAAAVEFVRIIVGSLTSYYGRDADAEDLH